MIVVFTKADPPQKWRVEGATFVVQEFYMEPDGKVLFRIEEPSEQTPGLVANECLEVVDGTIPGSWTVSDDNDGGYTIGPTAWQEQGFWERWMDQDPDARSTYQEFRSEIE